MFYNKDIKGNEVIFNGNLDGFDYYILSISGNHPCAYVVVDKSNPFYMVDLMDDLSEVVHGGITYCENKLNEIVSIDDEKWVFGWDYAHFGDYTTKTLDFMRLNSDFGDINGRKYSETEIMKDIESFVEFLKKNG